MGESQPKISCQGLVVHMVCRHARLDTLGAEHNFNPAIPILKQAKAEYAKLQ